MGYPSSKNLTSRVTLRQLQIFEMVVRLGGYTRAADALHLTQPTVSMQVKKLSDALGGVPLLEQVGRHSIPTAAGRDAYSAAQDIIARMVSLSDSTSERQGVVKGDLHISVITTATYFMPRLLGAFISLHPLVQPRLTVTNRARVLERLKSNKDDLLIMGQVPKGLAVHADPFIDNELVVVAHPKNSLVGAHDITLERLSQERFLIREPGSGTRLAVERMFREKDISVTPYMELGNSEAIKQGVMAGLGFSVLSRHNLRFELAGKQVAILDVKGFPLKRRWYAVHLKASHLTLVAQTFLEFILKESENVLSTDG